MIFYIIFLLTRIKPNKLISSVWATPGISWPRRSDRFWPEKCDQKCRRTDFSFSSIILFRHRYVWWWDLPACVVGGPCRPNPWISKKWRIGAAAAKILKWRLNGGWRSMKDFWDGAVESRPKMRRITRWCHGCRLGFTPGSWIRNLRPISKSIPTKWRL